MGCSLSTLLSGPPIGSITVTMMPVDNLDIGSFEIIYNFSVFANAFKHTVRKQAPGSLENKSSTMVYAVPLPGPIKELSVDFKFNDSALAIEANGKIDITLTRDGADVYEHNYFEGNPYELSSVTPPGILWLA